MSEEVPSEVGRRFAADLRAIREDRGVSIEDLHEETKIPRGLLESFETTGLFDHPMFNRVYLRSFVRTYADVTGISPAVALAALEEALEGVYTDRLAVDYLGRAPTAPASLPETEAASADDDAMDDETGDEAHGASTAVGTTPTGRTSAAGPSTGAPASRRADAERTDEPFPSRNPGGAAPPPDRYATSPARSAERSPIPTGETPRRQWMIIAGIGVALVLAAWFVIGYVGSDEPADVATTTESAEANAADTAEAEAQPAAPARRPVNIGDSLDVRVVSAGEPVRQLRVTLDDDVRRPYWIEAGESLPFQAADRIVLEDAPASGTPGQLDRIRLEVEGQAYPVDRRDNEGRIVLTRDALQSYYAGAQ